MAEPQAITSAREYETIYVLRPDAGRETSESIGTRVLDVISKQHGSLTRVENWGYRKLAYPVRKHGRGVYVYLKYVGDGALVSELERNLRLQDAVLKFQTVKIGKAAAAEAAKPEDIEFEHLDVVEDAEPEDSLAKTLGLEDVRDDYRGHHEAEREADDAEEEVPDLNNVGTE
jgi:small subunit ribosomal protein S6